MMNLFLVVHFGAAAASAGTALLRCLQLTEFNIGGAIDMQRLDV